MKKVLFLLLIVVSNSTFSQVKLDEIIKKNGDIISCTVSEIGADEVKYFYPDRPSLVFGIDKALVDQIKFATGEVISIEANSFMLDEYYINQKRRAIKTGFLKPLNTQLEFTYEQFIKPGRTWEATVGIVGVGFDISDRSPIGFYGKYTYKFIRTPDYYIQRMHYSHILKGVYFAPEIAARWVKYDYRTVNYNTWDYDTKRAEDFSVVFTLKLGKQWVFDNFFVVDLFGGIGYGITTMSDEINFVNYGFSITSNELPLALTSGLRIGIIF